MAQAIVTYINFAGITEVLQWNPSIVAPLNKDQPLNKGQVTTIQACYF